MYIGFDIGGSSVKAVLVKNKQVIKSYVEDLPDSLFGLLDLLEKIFSELSKDVSVEGVGVAVAGAMDAKREKMLNSPNIKYLNNQPLKKMIGERLGCLIKIEHDVHCFLLAEKEIGLAKNFNNIFYLTLGTGIGGAWMVGGKIYTGAHGSAGEAGHIIIDRNQDLEYLASNRFIKKELGLGSIKALKLAQEGDQKTREVFHRLGKNLGTGIANIINIFDPEAVIISGGISEAKEFIEPAIEENIAKYVVSPEAKKTKILFSELGRFGGALGATLLFK